VTLENVLSEHAGFARYMSSGSPEWADVAGISGSATEQRRQFAQRVLRRQPAAQPQRAWLAGNAGCPVAAAMAERVTGESFEVLMETLLFQPLGIRAELNWPAFLLPEVGIAMTPGDYAKFLQLHLKGLQGTDGILKSATIRRLHAAVDSASLLDRIEHRQGLGWVLQHFEGVPESYIAGSWGDSGNASHNFFFLTSLLPSRGIAVAVFSSASGNAARDACYEALVREMHRYPPNPKGS
jgi:CubicO group peptidase (beta-lactamase class C family)